MINRYFFLGKGTRHRKRFINQASAIAGQARNDDTFIDFVLFFYFLSCTKVVELNQKFNLYSIKKMRYLVCDIIR